MKTTSIRERYALDVFEPLWRRKGYDLVRDPSPHELPGFLKGFRPDAIATGVSPSLVIEVAAGQGPAKENKLHRLKSALDGQAEWRLEIIYVGSDGEPIKPITLDVANSTLQRATTLIGSDPDAALLLGWAAIEAIARILEPGLAEYSLGALALVDLLVGYGHLSQDSGAKLRALALKRNSVAHGELAIAPSAEDLSTMTALARELLNASPRRDAPADIAAIPVS